MQAISKQNRDFAEVLCRAVVNARKVKRDLESAEFSAALLGRCRPPMILDPHLGELIQLV